MSSETVNKGERIDAIVLAGSRGARKFDIRGKETAKPFLELGGEALVSRVVRAVLGARRVGVVYVVGDPQRLAETLEPLIGQNSRRIRLVEEGDSLVDNGYRVFFHHVLPGLGLGAPAAEHLDPAAVVEYRERKPEASSVPALVVTSDLPFLTSESIDHFLDGDPGDAAIVMGLIDYRVLARVEAVIGEQAVLDQWKLGALHFKRMSVRLSNMFLIRPLLGNPVVYSLLADVYDNRWLLKQDGSVNWRAWFASCRAILSYSLKVNGWFRFLRGMFNFVPSVIAASLARLTHRLGAWCSWPFRIFLSKNDVQFIGSLLIGTRGHLVVGYDPEPAIDIDVEESYESLADDGQKEFRRIERYLKESREQQARGNTDLSVPAAGQEQEKQAGQQEKDLSP